MKILMALMVLGIFACKESPKQSIDNVNKTEEQIEVKAIAAPIANIRRVFEAHGGLKNWKEKRTLTFELAKPDTKEVHTTDLYSRRDRIEMEKISMGFDVQQVWLVDEKRTYNGDPVFYHNLMFYFYAMPFVLGDSGIQYGETDNLEYEGTHYPGIRISYNSGVGTSPKDEYFVHYNPNTYQMEWLGYTVTYRSGEKSDNVKWIRYNDWMTVEGMVLPKSITWFDYEGRTLKGPRNTVKFENVLLSEIAKPTSFYTKPEGARTVDSSN